MFKKASRQQAKLRLALCGVSGSGKTYSALKLAKGMGFSGKIAFIDTEFGSASLYAGVVDFDVCQLEAPFSPDRYIQAIKHAESAGYDVIIIDSLSHAWAGSGGVLDMQDKATQASASKNSYFAWRSVTPEHNKLVDALVQSKSHIICCMRSKAQHEVMTDSSGKVAPIKLGLAPIQREGMDYEFTIVLDLDHKSHYFTSSKDRTDIYEGKHDVISEKHGELIMDWINDGDPVPTIEELKNQSLEMIKSSKSLTELKSAFDKACSSDLRKDSLAMNKIIELKDEKKLELSTLRAA